MNAKSFFSVAIPGFYFFLQGEILYGFAALILQWSLVGWIPAIIWAQADLQRRKSLERLKKAFQLENSEILIRERSF